jgi:hypothetical protein
MTDQLFTSVVTVATAIVGVAILAVLVSKQAQTPQVISALTGGFAQDLAAAVSPVTGGSGGFTGGGVSIPSIY